MTDSLITSLVDLPQKQRHAFVDKLTEEQAEWAQYDWTYHARPEQLPPKTDWRVWVVLAGRGYGKTRLGAMWVHKRAMEGNENRRIAIASKTPGDARDDILHGLGGLLKNTHPSERPTYNPSNRRVTWPTGAWATVYSGAHPEQARGFSGDTLWCDELAAWKYPSDTWQNLVYGMREARISQPQILVTTTPKPILLMRQLVELCEKRETWVLVRGSSYDNKDNLAGSWFEEHIATYEGTSLGAQEIYAELLTEMPGALWTREVIEQCHWTGEDEIPYTKIVVGVDPAITSNEESNETGIVVAGLGKDGHGYVFADMSCRKSPRKWAQMAVNGYHEYNADLIVAESNQGGEMVRETIRTVDPDVPIKLVHATRGKRTRAEPISAKYEAGMVHHLQHFGRLEDQLCTWQPNEDKDSPDRLDALVWALSELMLKPEIPKVLPVSLEQENPWRIE